MAQAAPAETFLMEEAADGDLSGLATPPTRADDVPTTVRGA
jgi:hypothetical protein